MGLFGSKKTYVSSTLYNLAGDIKDRPDFLKTVVVGNALSGSKSDIASAIQSSYTNGPGLKLRRYYDWAVDNYQSIGIPQGTFSELVGTPAEIVGGEIPHTPEQTPVVQQFEVSMADFSYWAEQWMFDNRYDLIQSNWVSDYDDVSGKIRITLEDGAVEEFTPENFDKDAAYLFATYVLSSSDIAGQAISNPPVFIAQDESFPLTDGYTLVNEELNQQTVSLVKSTHVYWLSEGPESAEPITTTEDKVVDSYQADYLMVTYEGGMYSTPGDQLTSRQDTYLFRKTGRAVKGEEVRTEVTGINPDTQQKDTRVTIKSEDALELEKYYISGSQDITDYDWTKARTFIYKIGSGNAVLDRLVILGDTNGGYLPYVPVRLDNKFLSESYQPAAYSLAKKAYKKAVSGDLDDLIDKLKDNKDLKDIDYAYVMFGVSLNIKDNSCKKYIYEFFKKLMGGSATDIVDYSNWKLNQAIAKATNDTWLIWRTAQNDPTSDLFGTAEPPNANYTTLPTSQIQIKASGSLPTNVDMRITWQSIYETHSSGLAKPGAKVGEVWFDTLPDDVYENESYSNGEVIHTGSMNVARINLRYQVTADTYTSLHITGLVHRNYIYNGKYVEITATEAFADVEESGFLIPLHYETLKDMSLKDSTQVATTSCYVVLNSYLIVKQKWYQTAIFKIVLVIAVIAITYATGGFGASSAGLLGTNAAVGAAIGATGTLAIIVGAVANAIAAMILTKLITAGATAVFGDKFGAIIGAIASVVALQVGTALNSGSSFASLIPNMARADNIIALTSAAGAGISGYIQAGARETLEKTKELQKSYTAESKELTDKYEELIGYGRAILDPLSLTENGQFVPESSSVFLERTLMTGSDVAEMSHSLLTNFADITLSTELS